MIVGCGAAKRDEAALAKDLYTSTYFAKKREYAETIGDEWRILSAEHGLLDPYEEIEPYETSIDDLDEDELNRLAGDVGLELIDLTVEERVVGRSFDEIVVLAGRKYLDPLRERDAFAAGISEVVTFPLQQNDLAGIGEQMAWLAERVSLEGADQTRLVPDGGERPSGEEDQPDTIASRLREILTDPLTWIEPVPLVIGLSIPVIVFPDHAQVAAYSAVSGSIAMSITEGLSDD